MGILKNEFVKSITEKKFEFGGKLLEGFGKVGSDRCTAEFTPLMSCIRCQQKLDFLTERSGQFTGLTSNGIIGHLSIKEVTRSSNSCSASGERGYWALKDQMDDFGRTSSDLAFFIKPKLYSDLAHKDSGISLSKGCSSAFFSELTYFFSLALAGCLVLTTEEIRK